MYPPNHTCKSGNKSKGILYKTWTVPILHKQGLKGRDNCGALYESSKTRM